MIKKNWEIHWYPETSANKAKTKSLTWMSTAEKAMKERDRTQMPVAKKERTDHKCLWQRKKDQTTNAGGKWKMAALISQANSWHQMKETKQLKPPQNPKQLPIPASIRWKKHPEKNITKSQQSNRLLSATKEWMTTVIRALSKNNCANDKQMKSLTNSKLTWLPSRKTKAADW